MRSLTQKQNADTGRCELTTCISDLSGLERGGWQLLIPDGLVRCTNGNFTLDEESARQIMGAFRDHGVDLVIDFEHQTLGGQYASPSGRAPAAGWITALRYERGRGLLGRVSWTDDAEQHIQARAYRYLSPVVAVRKSDRKTVALHSAGVTNKPAIVGMAAIAATEDVANWLRDLEVQPAALRTRLDRLEKQFGIRRASVSSRRLDWRARHALTLTADELDAFLNR